MLFFAKNKNKYFFLALFISIGILWSTQNVSAAGKCQYWKDGNVTVNVADQAACQAICQKDKDLTRCNYKDDAAPNENPASYAAVKGGAELPDIGGGILATPIIWLLKAILTVNGWLLSVAAIIFEFAVAPASISDPATGLLNSAAISEIWRMVRDFLNMIFIFVLLFSAFGTIFQMDKYNINKVWKSILINALLVNFSFPIARFIIDIANVMMYYLINNMFSGSGGSSASSILANIGYNAQLGGLLNPKDFSESGQYVAYLVAQNIFLFIFGMTILIFAAMFLVRLIMLAALVMFSPIAFVGNISPDLKQYSKKWWSNLFNYSFFGPIMIFGMLVSMKVMDTVNTYNSRQIMAQARLQGVSAPQATWFGQIALYIIPIVLLWITMGTAKSFGIQFADTVYKKVNAGGTWLRKKAWNMTGGAALRTTKKAYNDTGIPGGLKNFRDDFRKSGKVFGKKMPLYVGSKEREAREKELAARMSGGSAAVVALREKQIISDANDFAKENNLDLLTNKAIEEKLKTANAAQKLAFLEEQAKRGTIEASDLDDYIKTHGENSLAGKRIISKVKESGRPDLAFQHISDENKRENEMANYIKSGKAKPEEWDAKTLENEQLVRLAIANGKMNKKTLDNLNDDQITAYKSTLSNLLNEKDSQNNFKYSDTSNAVSRNIHLAYLAQHGEIHSSINNSIDPIAKQRRAAVFERMNKDMVKNMTVANISPYVHELAQNVNSGEFKDMIRQMKSEVKREVISKIKAGRYNPANSDEANAYALRNQIISDPALNSIA